MSGLRFKSLLLSYFNFNSELHVYIQLMFQCTCSLENYRVMYTQFKEKKNTDAREQMTQSCQRSTDKIKA